MGKIYGVRTPGKGSIRSVTEKAYESIGADIKEFSSILPVLQRNHIIYRKIPKFLENLESGDTAIIPSIDLAAGIKKPVKPQVLVLAHDIHTVTWRNGNSISRRNKLKGIKNLSNCDKAIALSKNTETDIFKYRKNKGMKDIQVETISQAFEKNKFYAEDKEPEEIELPEQYILYAGSLGSRKYPEFIINIAEKTGRNLVIAGNLKQRKEDIQKYIENKGMKNQVQFTGYLSTQDLRRTYSNAGIYLHAALFEGYGRTPVEAAACGTKPVIPENTGCQPDLPVAETYNEWNTEKVAQLVQENFGQKVEYQPKTWEEFAEEFRGFLGS